MARLRKSYHVRENKTQILQLTAMVDMFTVLLVFLLKSYTTSSVRVNPVDDLRLPASTAQKEPAEALKLVVSTKGIYVDDKKILDIKDGKISDDSLDQSDANFIRPLYNELDAMAKNAEDLQAQNPEAKFTGAYILQADQSLSYSTLRKVIYTSMLAGYADLKLGSMGLE
tara:strand:+ start:10333 stop:10842 length:510 start_codon:yes stop_codon:yes gene_type:complete